MRTADEAQSCWQALDRYSSLHELKQSVRLEQGAPSVSSGLRSVCWKAFLLFENVDRSTWPAILSESRSAYNTLCTHYLRAIEHPDEVETSVDPLSDNQQSPWVALRVDEDIRNEIFQDVQRCMPDSVYFRQPSTQKMLLDILFVYCKLNPDVGYRQGMHELVAPILWVVERDAVDASRLRGEEGGGDEQKLMLSMFDAEFVEHDTFTLFSLIMLNGKSFYEPAITTKSSDKKGSSRDSTVQSESPLLVTVKRIFETFLPKADPELAARLQKLDVSPQIFLMRWIRLLFGREFAFDDVLPMWDMLFAEDPSLKLVDH
ncbi:hypothetical protein LTS18_001632, partial [Coniosporium uncinatum]